MKHFGLLAVAALSLASLSSAQSSQTLPVGLDAVQGGAGTSYPFNSTTSHIWQWHYDNANFTQTGPITITEISIRALTPTQTISAFDFPSLVVTCAEATTDYQVGAHDPVFANNLGVNQAVVRSGAWTGGPVGPSGGSTATWIPFGLTTPFTFDPTTGADFIIQLETCGPLATVGGSIDGRSGSVGVNLGNRYGDTASCSSASYSFNNNEFVPVVLIEYTAGAIPPTTYCTPGTSTNGCLASIGYTGAPSASGASSFVIDVASVEGQKQGLIFYGVDNTGFTPLAWGTTFFCVKPPTMRSFPQGSGGTSGMCDGSLTLDWNAFQASMPGALGQPFSVGDHVYAQAWFRDPPSAKTTLFSDALEFVMAP